jgi:hypothetical protein
MFVRYIKLHSNTNRGEYMQVGPTGGGGAEHLAAVQQSQAKDTGQQAQAGSVSSAVESTVPTPTQSSGNHVNTTA